MKNLTDYTIVLRPDDNGTFIANIPAIKGCHAWGETPEQAREELQNVFEMIYQEYIEIGKTLPKDVNLIIANAC